MPTGTPGYGEGELGEVRIVLGHLPLPDHLVLRDEGVKVTPTSGGLTGAFLERRGRVQPHALSEHDPMQLDA